MSATAARARIARLVAERVSGIGRRRRDCGTLSLRRTKSALIGKQAARLRTVPILLGLSKVESAARHRGVDVEDALTPPERTGI